MDKQEIERRGNEALNFLGEQTWLADHWTGLKFIVIEMNPPDRRKAAVIGYRKKDGSGYFTEISLLGNRWEEPDIMKGYIDAKVYNAARLLDQAFHDDDSVKPYKVDELMRGRIPSPFWHGLPIVIEVEIPLRVVK